MCFKKDNSAKKALKWQKQQAAEAAKQEAERQARLKQGTETINALFDGTPVMGERDATYDWSKFTTKTTGGGAGTTQRPVNPSIIMNGGGKDADRRDGNTPYGNDQNSSYNRNAKAGGGTKFTGTVPEGYTAKKVNGQWVLVGSDGKTYKKGDTVAYKEKYDTGAKTGGFGDDFYNKYRDATLAYYEPELAKQYEKARSNLTYDHARAGTLQSSMAGENLADLLYQNTNNTAMIRSKADAATGQLKTSVAGQKAAALGQLYATEDPGIAANVATNSVRNLQSTTPEFEPMGQLFNNAVVGATNYAGAYNDYQNWGSPSGNSRGSGRTIG